MRKRGLRYTILIAMSFLMVYPIIWWVGASFKSNEEMSSPEIFPAVFKWSNFTEGWHAISKYSFTHFYMNSAKLMIILIIVSIISCSFVAFGFARLEFPLRKLWFALLLGTLMLPAQVTMIPQYTLFSQLNWINTYLPFYIPHALAGGIGGSFFIYLLIQFIRGIPKELDESAKIDGCSWFRIYWNIIMPLLRPALVTIIIYCYLWNWDDFFGQLLYIGKVQNYTVPLALRLMNDSQSATDWGQLLAMGLASVIPSAILFFLAQKHFVDGIATTGLKI